MVGRTDWPMVLRDLEDDKLYSLKEIRSILLHHGFDVQEQTIYRWIRHKNIQKRGTVSGPLSSQNLVVWLGVDLKNAAERSRI